MPRPSLDEIFGAAPAAAARPSLDEIFQAPAEPQAPPGPPRIPEGASTLDGIARATLPRAAESISKGQGLGRQLGAAALDAISLPGRIIGSGIEQMGMHRLNKATAEGQGLGGRLLAGAKDVLMQGMPPVSDSPEENKAVANKWLNSAADTEGQGIFQRTLRDPGTAAALATAPIGGAAGGAVAGLTRGLGLGARVLGAGAAGAVEGAASAAAHQADRAVQGEGASLADAAKEVVLNAGLSASMPVLGAAAKKGLDLVGEGLKMHGNKVVTQTIKPSLKDTKDGFRVANVYKHQLEGTLEETEEKLANKFQDLTQQLREKINSSDAKLDLIDLLDEATTAVGADKAGNFGKNSQMEKAAGFLLEEINQIAPDGVVDLATAQKLKRGLGKMGAWEWGKTDPEASARETLANTMYSKLKDAIEKSAPEGVKEINQQLAELIPIERAVTRRIPIEARNSNLSLTDIITGSAGAAGGLANGLSGGLLAAAGGVALNKVRKDPRLAGYAYRLGEGLQQSGMPGIPGAGLGIRRLIGTGNFSETDDRK